MRSVMTEESENVGDIDPHVEDESTATGPADDLEEISVSDVDPTRKLKLGSGLQQPLRGNLETFLRMNLDVFAWFHEDMLEIDTRIVAHYLNIDPKARPVKQKRRKFALRVK